MHNIVIIGGVLFIKTANCKLDSHPERVPMFLIGTSRRMLNNQNTMIQ